MKNLYKIFTVILFSIVSVALQAQSQNIDFILQGTLTKISEQSVDINISIVKTGNILVLNQIAGNKTRSTQFNIISTTQNWDTSTSQGTSFYALDLNEELAEFVLTGLNTGILAVLTINDSESEQEIYTFNIATITYQ